KGTYAGLKDAKLTGKVNFRYQVNGTSDVKDLLTDGKIKLNKDAYAHSYELDGKYTGVKDLELTAGAFVQHVHYANAELGDYVANPFELLYASSLISKDKDFFKHYAEALKLQKEAFEEAQKTLKNATEAEKKAYEDAVKEYNKLVADKKDILKNRAEKRLTAYNNVASDKKAAAKKAYDKFVEIIGYRKEFDDLKAKKSDLDAFIEKFSKLSKDEFENTTEQAAELKKLDDQIKVLSSYDVYKKGKMQKAYKELDKILKNGNKNIDTDIYKGVLLASAEYYRDNFK
ncbi:hypothetical protein ACFFBA_000730, partial [Sneathia vaginalis]